MLNFVVRRLALVVPTFFGVTLLAFALVRLIPGDPIVNMMGEQGLDAARLAVARADLGLDRPLPVQYLVYVADVLRGDLGRSIATSVPVLTEFRTLFPATLELGACALFIALVLGLPAGVIAAIRRGTMVDHALMTVSVVGYCMPIFWWALLLILLFSGILGWTPVSGRMSAMYYPEPVTGFMLIDAWLSDEVGASTSAASHLMLPAVVLSTFPLAVIARMTRSSMLEVLEEDYIRTARAKGLAPFIVVSVHALRNALIPVVTVIGLQVGVIVTGAIMTETIFSWPGVGKWLVDAIFRRDYPVVQGGILLIATVVIVVNVAVDLVYGAINPRIRRPGGAA